MQILWLKITGLIEALAGHHHGHTRLSGGIELGNQIPPDKMQSPRPKSLNHNPAIVPASVLSFMLRGIGIPVVLTGAQLPITHPLTDGRSPPAPKASITIPR